MFLEELTSFSAPRTLLICIHFKGPSWATKTYIYLFCRYIKITDLHSHVNVLRSTTISRWCPWFKGQGDFKVGVRGECPPPHLLNEAVQVLHYSVVGNYMYLKPELIFYHFASSEVPNLQVSAGGS